MNKCLFCKRVIEKGKICPRCGSIIKDIVLGVSVTIIGFIYILLPVDFIPEAFLGAVGLTDDAATLLGIIGFDIYSIIKIVRKLC